MKIAIEATLAGEKQKTGLGVYVDLLLRGLSTLPQVKADTVYLFHHDKEWQGANYGPNFIPVSYRCGPSGLAAVTLRLNATLKRIGADVFHAPGTTGVPPFCAVPSLTTVHDIFPLTMDGFSQKQRTIMKLLFRWTLNNSTAIAFNSEFTRNEVGKYAKQRDFSDSAILYPGSQFEFFHGSHVKQGKTPDRPYILYVGAIETRKGQVDFCKGYLDALQIKPDLPDLLFVGPDRGDLTKLQSMMLPGKGKIRHISYATAEELYFLYQNAAVFAFLSRQEGFGMPLLEAMTFHLPILCSDLPVFHEICGEKVQYMERKAPAICDRILDWEKIPPTDFTKEDAQRFSWIATAEKTYEIYRMCKAKSQRHRGCIAPDYSAAPCNL